MTVRPTCLNPGIAQKLAYSRTVFHFARSQGFYPSDTSFQLQSFAESGPPFPRNMAWDHCQPGLAIPWL